MDLTNDDVADILALLDSLPYDSLDLRTDRFHLTLRRSPGGWTEESEALAPPTDVTPEGARAWRADRAGRAWARGRPAALDRWAGEARAAGGGWRPARTG